MRRSYLFALFFAVFGISCDGARGWADFKDFIDGLQGPAAEAAQTDAKIVELFGDAKKQIAAGDVQAAQKLLEGLKAHPDVADVDVVIADLMFTLGRSAEGQQWLERASAAEPQRLAIYLAFCELAVRQRRWFDGWSLARLAEQIEPPPHWSPVLKERVQSRLMLLNAVCCEGRTQWMQARHTYEKLLTSVPQELTPLSWDVSLGLARSCFQLKDYDAALVALNTLATQDPNMSHPQQLLAQWLEQNQMTIEADESYRISVAEANLRQRAAARLAYARFLIHHNEPTRAKPLLKMPITADEGVHAEAQEADRLFLQAVIARLESRFAEAQATLSKLHQERRDSVAVSNHLAAILVEHEDEGVRGRALQITESMVRNTPKSADAWATLGWVQLRLGDVIAAEASLGQSLKLGNPSRDTLHYLAQMKRLSGRTDEAESLDRLYESAKGPKFFLTPKAAN